jgi:putative 4-mercaptohistidine N1-methyltranferase
MANMYETDALVAQYLLFHYGSAADQCPFENGPKEALFYPIRCVTEFMAGIGRVERALDLGCAVGRSTFELTRWANQSIGIDLSKRFIQAAKEVQMEGVARFERLERGEIKTAIEQRLPDSIDRTKASFEVGDATALREDIGTFDVVLAANLIDRVQQPGRLLGSFERLISTGGFLILASPYTWLDEFTPKSEWIGGKYSADGAPQEIGKELEKALGPNFVSKEKKDLPFLIREHARKYQWSVAQATLWRKI